MPRSILIFVWFALCTMYINVMAQHHHRHHQQLASSVVNILHDLFTSPAPTVLTTARRHRIEVENEFLIKKVVSLRRNIASYDTAIEEYDALTGRLAEENAVLRATTTMPGAGDAFLRETVAALEGQLHRLEEENEALWRIIPLCLTINLLVLCYFGWDHVQLLLPRALRSPPSSSALAARVRQFVAGTVFDAYRGLYTTVHHLVLVVS